jgi:hypothetical protein
MWRELVQDYSSEGVFANPATESELEWVEGSLDIKMPASLRALLRESDGMALKIRLPGEGDEVRTLVWSTDEMLSQNLELRAQDALHGKDAAYPYFFFARETNGDPMAFPVKDGQAQESPIVVLSHDHRWERRTRDTDLRGYVEAVLKFAAARYGVGKKEPV